jgi:hypothetical protein
MSTSPHKRRAVRRNARRAAYERPVEQLVEATLFTDDPTGQDPVELVRQLRRYPHVLKSLERYEADLRSEDGRPRAAGSWVLLYIAYVMSGATVMHRFWTKWRSSPIWKLCGFGDWYPDYNTLQVRFAELEETGLAAVMRGSGDELVQRGWRHDHRIGVDGGADATSFAAHARLRHCCPKDKHGRFTCRKDPTKGKRPPITIGRADGDLVEKERHKEAAEPSEEPKTDPREGMKPLADDDERLDTLPEGYRYFESHDGHLYRLRDQSSGPRRYARGDAWVGGLLMGIADVFTGAPLALKAVAADDNEYQEYPDLLARAQVAANGRLMRVAADRAYSRPETFRHNTEQGVASIFPFRRLNGSEPKRECADHDDFDRHGVPRCRHCGGPGDVSGAKLGFHITRDRRPVLRYRCMAMLTADCDGIQEIGCANEWRILVPLSRRHPSYHAMAVAGKSLERTWSAWRERYGLAGKRPETRPRRREAIPCQELRAQTARFIEWFRVLLRHGFIGSARRRPAEAFPFNGEWRLRAMERARTRHGLDRPRGAHAIAAGFLPEPKPPPDDEIPF